jgi:hypothetical protein
MQNRFVELWQEFRVVFSGKNNTIDTILPPIVFALVDLFAGLAAASLSALGLAVFLSVFRLVRGESWMYAISGLVLTALAAGLVWFTQSAVSFFLPALITSGITLAAMLISIWAGKPLAAWSSHLTRAWPRDWYWLPNIRPAYIEVTWMWSVFIAARLAAQYYLYQQGDTILLGWVNGVLDWPAMIVVLAGSYIYGLWRLARLGGPSVEEYTTGQPAPWKGQKKGF